jgi:hypothetical protein
MTYFPRLLIVCLLFPLGAWAAQINLFQGTQKKDGINYSISPLYGFQSVYYSSPTPHTSTQSMYGVRVTAGVDLLSLEAEYSKSGNTENYAADPTMVKHDDQNYQLGLLSTVHLGNFVSLSGRAGCQASQDTETDTNSGVDTTTTTPLTYNPYAGAQIGIHFGVISVNASSTMVFKDNHDMSKNDVQNVLSVGVGY